MRTLFYIILLTICFLASNAQTKLKPAPLSTLSYLGNTLSLEDTSIWAPRIQKHFMLGWQWQGPSEKTNKRLHCNFFHDNSPSSSSLNCPSILTAETYCASIVSVITTKQTFDLSEVVNSMGCTLLQTFDLSEVVNSLGCTLLQTFDLSEVVVFAVRSVVSTDRQPIPMKRLFGIFSASVYSVSN